MGRGATLPSFRVAGVAASAFFSPEQPATADMSNSADNALKNF
jgi:hypothetical protein